jgi:ATP synthase regulation protein NCA2
MQAIDKSLASNEFNLRLMAIVPAVLVAWTSTQCAKWCYYGVTRAKSQAGTVAAVMC